MFGFSKKLISYLNFDVFLLKKVLKYDIMNIKRIDKEICYGKYYLYFIISCCMCNCFMHHCTAVFEKTKLSTTFLICYEEEKNV